VLGDHRRLREGHGSFRGGRIGRSRSGRGDRVAAAARNWVERALKCPSRQRLTRVAGRAQFALSTPTSAGRGRADGGAPKFICGLATDGGLFHAFFCPQPTNRRLFCGLGRYGGSARVALTTSSEDTDTIIHITHHQRG
jgi:hypothetical protein